MPPSTKLHPAIKALLVALIVALSLVLGSERVREILGLVESASLQAQEIADEAQAELPTEVGASSSSSDGESGSGSSGA